MSYMKKKFLLYYWLSVCSWALFFVPGIIGIAIAQEKSDQATELFSRPTVIYVADFLLDAQAQKKEEPGMLQVRKRIKSKVNQEDPQEKARKIVNVLADSIVSELNGKGLKSVRYSGQTKLISGSWLLEGEIFEYDEGDRLKRAIIGFGSGSAQMEVMIKISEVMDGGLRTIYDTTMDGKKSRRPGAIVTKNPYVAGAKFIMTKAAPEKDVKKLGTQIADKLIQSMEKAQTHVVQP